MVPKKSNSSNMAKVAEAINKKIVAEGSGKEVPSEVLGTQLAEVDTIARVTPSKIPPSSSIVEPPKKRQRETNDDGPSREITRNCLFCANSHYDEHLDDVATRNLFNQCLFQAVKANNMHFAQISKLKASYTGMEVKKNQMEDALKSVEVSMKEQKAQHKVEIVAREAEIDK
ncbi:hypothetical protein JCGZ_15359 [Jatropha curcas]|uniref:Uncharacterized protein n=1 Tax=Jatropha curcas TaxID=180498 RepID=A0A067KI41_JATCU|nr:hypothetical protein JCGZ_15359 [Jatropha curcas]